jgi:M6 family metalloprotease-like protein
MRTLIILTLGLITLPHGSATEPPRGGGSMPDWFVRRIREQPDAYTFKRALLPLMDRLAIARKARASAGAFEKFSFGNAVSAAFSVGPMVVSGTKLAPVLPVRFKDTPEVPYPPANLQKELFDGPWPTGTMTQFYDQASNHLFRVTGKVADWKQLPQNASYYEGSDYTDDQGVQRPCNGGCPNAKLAGFIKDALDGNSSIDWSQYDNDGPDGIPNSGDDDGYVDFVAFVQAKSGGECQHGQTGIWSHRWSLTSVPDGNEYVTKTPRKGGGFIRINDYVITPAFACDGTTMIQIGVFAHEFGHVFGLPDLYDVDGTNGKTEGIGNWCLMSGGSWGGDGDSPERPTHFSAWALEYLGWAHLTIVERDSLATSIPAIEDSSAVYKMRASPHEYYLVNNLARKGFNAKLPAPGLQIWKIDETIVTGGLRNNRVNAGPEHGVELVEADGLRQLYTTPGFRGGPDDVYPGLGQHRLFDSSQNPASIGNVAVCAISDPGNAMTASLIVSRPTCNTGPAPVPSAANSPALPPPSAGPTLQEVLQRPQEFLGKTVRLIGVIENTGANYFSPRDRQLVLTDSSGNKVNVISNLPTELPPPPPGSHQQPGTEASILGKKVEVTAVVQQDAAHPEKPVLRIQRAVPAK